MSALLLLDPAPLPAGLGIPAEAWHQTPTSVPPQWLALLQPVAVGKRQEDPAALLATLEHAGVGEDLQVTRDTRLALTKYLRKLADGQLHQPQKCDDAQPRRIGKSLESIGKRKRSRHEIRI